MVSRKLFSILSSINLTRCKSTLCSDRKSYIFTSICRNIQTTCFFLLAMCLTSSVSAVTFECEFKMAGVPLVVLGDVYLCMPTVIIDDEGSKVLEKVTGEHLESKTNDDVILLNIFENHNMSFVPKNIIDFFSNLKGLNWHDSNLDKISADDLKPFTQLKYLGIRFTHLKTLDSDLFQHTPHLQYITFAGSRIHHVGTDLVTNLKELKILDFTNCECIHKIAKTPELVAQLNKDLPIKCHPEFTPKIDDELLVTESSEDSEKVEKRVEL